MSNTIMTLPLDGRTLAVGRTGSGKSFLSNNLMWVYLKEYPQATVLILDTSTNYRGQWQANGLKADSLYRKVDSKKTYYVPGSFVLDFKRPVSQLKELYKNTRIVIAQSEKQEEWYTLMEASLHYYEAFSANKPRLLMIDELADFYEVKRQGGIFWRAARAGRKHNFALLAGSQRPRFIPTPVLTECDRYYIFYLDNREDMKKMYELGVPRDQPAPIVDKSFFYWNKFERNEAPSGKYYVLQKEEEA